MRRREMLKAASLAAVGLSAFPLRWVAAAETKRQKVLYFTRSAGFEHSAVHRDGDQLSHSREDPDRDGQAGRASRSSAPRTAGCSTATWASTT